MIVEVFEDLLALGLLVILDCDVPLLELLVLTIVLASDLLILLPNDVRLAATILIFQCLLVEELLFDLSLDCGHIDLLLQRLHPIEEQFIECVRTLLEGHLNSLARTLLQLDDLDHDLPKHQLDIVSFIQNYNRPRPTY